MVGGWRGFIEGQGQCVFLRAAADATGAGHVRAPANGERRGIRHLQIRPALQFRHLGMDHRGRAAAEQKQKEGAGHGGLRRSDA